MSTHLYGPLSRADAERTFRRAVEDGHQAELIELEDGQFSVVIITADVGQTEPDPVERVATPRHTPPADDMPLGSLSRRFESNGKPGAIGCDRNGGWSYGAYQIACRPGTLAAFLAFLQDEHADLHAPLDAAGGGAAAARGDPAFHAAWRELAHRPEFGRAQHAYIQATHYTPYVEALQRDLGLDADARSAALRDVLWSIAVQHGPSNRIAQTALDRQTAAAASDRQIIDALYDERSRVDAYFTRSTRAVQQSVLSRFESEREQALQRCA